MGLFSPKYLSAYYEQALGALKKITDPRELAKAAAYDPKKTRNALLPIRALAAWALNDRDLYLKTVCRETNLDAFRDYIDSLKDFQQLELLYRYLGNPAGNSEVSNLNEKKGIVFRKYTKISEERRKAQMEETVLSLNTDEDRAAFIISNPKDAKVEEVLGRIQNPDQLKRILSHPSAEFGTRLMIFRRLKYTEKQQFLESLRGGFEDCLSPAEEKKAIDSLSVEDLAGIPLTLELFDRIYERSTDKKLAADIAKAYGKDSLMKDLEAILRKQRPKQKQHIYRDGVNGALWASRVLRLLYENDCFRDQISLLKGTVIDDPEKMPSFNMNDPEEREWANGYSPKSGRIFDPEEKTGYRFFD